jgi:methionyl-tRNA synthetase
VNDRSHIGHAYTTVACDAMARFKRLDGCTVMFVTGTDEHGQKVAQSARKAGIPPKEFCDLGSENFREMNRLMNISNDQFIRTTDPNHIAACQALWATLEKRGYIYRGVFKGWYATRDEAFYEEKELKNGKAPTGADVEWVEEENFFFRLSAFEKDLLALYEANPRFIAPAGRRKEVISFVRGGLRDLSISRTSLTWGVPVPGAPGHVMYVWMDALTNYLTACGYPDCDGAMFQTFWPADLHMVGKDIVRFHCVYWPAFLMAAGLPLPRRVYAHGWWTVEGEKMSKSAGNFITPQEVVGRYGLDAVRYFMLRELAFGSDGDFSHKAMVGRINGDLANDLGNLAHRVQTMVSRNCGQKVPTPDGLEPDDMMLMTSARSLLDGLRTEFDDQAFHRALERLWRLIAETNRYIDAMAPWRLRKEDPDRLATVLYCALEAIRHVAILMQPVMPNAAEQLLDQLGIPPGERSFGALSVPMRPGTKMGAPMPIFPRFVSSDPVDASGKSSTPMSMPLCPSDMAANEI